ncbi:hypothetical protein [Chryseobacterium sp.]|uniref:hypothetical protein n=1 Tax=Chryseobacterium sp. TaxID=1871047 RepID=UPI00321A1430
MTDKAKAAIATLENLGYTHEGGILWKPPLGKAPDFNLLDTLHARIASLEAQLSARQAAPDGWRLVPVASTAAMEWAFRSAEVRYSNGAGRMLPMDPHSAFKAQYREMLSAAPPPPEREQPAVDGWYTITIECGAAQARFVITEMQIESAPSPAEYVGYAVAKAIAAIDKRRSSHEIGATNDNP